MEKREKKRVKSFCVLLECLGVAVLSFLVCALLYMDVSGVEAFRSKEAEISAAEGFRFQLDYVKDNGNDISIQGRAYIEGEETDFFNCALVLKMADGEDCYRIPTSLRINTDTEAGYDNTPFDYDHNSFFARVEKSRIPSGTYEIYVEFDTYTKPALYATDHTFVCESE